MFSIHQPWVFTFGILGNIISFMVYLAAVPTFYRIIKKKSTEGFQSVPYLSALFSATLWIYYASVKSGAYILIIINSVGCVIETVYIVLYISYAPKKARVMTLKLLILLNFVGFWLIVLVSHFLVKRSNRVHVLGWICVAFSVCVFAAPLSIVTQVIRTKSVEFMPFWLSFFLASSAVTWFFYGLLQKDLFIALPNILGFIFGILQMVLYVIYRNSNKALPTSVKLTTTMTPEVHPVCSEPICEENREVRDQNSHEPICDENREVRDQNSHGQTDHDEESMDASNQV